MPFLAADGRIPTHGAESAAWRFDLATDEPTFAGHFDGEPILPGIVHVAIALEACALLVPATPMLVGIDDLRFTSPLGPGDRCRITIAPLADTMVRFEIQRDEAPASRGVLRFAAAWWPA